MVYGLFFVFLSFLKLLKQISSPELLELFLLDVTIFTKFTHSALFINARFHEIVMLSIILSPSLSPYIFLFILFNFLLLVLSPTVFRHQFLLP